LALAVDSPVDAGQPAIRCERLIEHLERLPGLAPARKNGGRSTAWCRQAPRSTPGTTPRLVWLVPRNALVLVAAALPGLPAAYTATLQPLSILRQD
jgi:hypothetical protein